MLDHRTRSTTTPSTFAAVLMLVAMIMTIGVASAPPAYATTGSMTVAFSDASANPIDGGYLQVLGEGFWFYGSYEGDEVSFDSLAPGAYSVWAEPSGEPGQWYGPSVLESESTPVIVEAGVTTLVDFQTGPTGSLEVTMTDPDGQPLDGGGVYVQDSAGEFVAFSSLSDGNNVMVVDKLLVWGGYRVQAWYFDGYLNEYYGGSLKLSGADAVEIQEGTTTEVAFQLSPTGSVSGTVTRDGVAPVANPDGLRYIDVFAEDDEGQWNAVTFGVTDTAGNYEVTGLIAGEYKLGFIDDLDNVPYHTVEGLDALTPSLYWDQQDSIDDANVVTVVVDETFTADAELKSVFHLFDAEGNTFETEIRWMADRGVSTGYSDGNFRPSASVTRQAMSAFMYRLAGSPEFGAPDTSPFTDVATSHPFYAEIAWMAQEDISTGYPDDTFRPTANVSRMAMSAFMYRFAEEPAFSAPGESPFDDVATDHPFYTEIAWMADAEISTGYPDDTYRPSANVTRQAMAAFMFRLDELLNPPI